MTESHGCQADNQPEALRLSDSIGWRLNRTDGPYKYDLCDERDRLAVIALVLEAQRGCR